MIAKLPKVSLVVSLLGLISAPVLGQNLLTNGAFESLPHSGFPSGWLSWNSGAGVQDQHVANSSDGSLFHTTPRVYEGSYCFFEGDYWLNNQSSRSSGLKQVITTTPGSVYKLSGAWHVGDQFPQTWHEIGVFDGNITDDNTIKNGPGSLTYVSKINVAGESLSPGWDTFQRFFVPTQSQITVYTKLGSNNSDQNLRANWFDALAVQAITGPVVTAINPSYILTNNGDTNATLSGYNLTGATVVRLHQGATDLIASNVVIAGNGKSLTCTFPTTLAAYTVYDVVVEKTGFDNGVLPAGFAIRNPGADIGLLNGGFETPNFTSGWTTWNANWGSNISTAIDNSQHIYDTPPVVHGGTYRLSIQGTGTGDLGVVQTVNGVVPGETLTLSWWWKYGDTYTNTTNCYHEVGVYGGTRANAWSTPADVASKRVGGTNGATVGWVQDSLTFLVPANVNAVTISLKMWQQPPTKDIATYWDDVTLTSPSACSPQQSISSLVSPPTPSVVDPTQSFTVRANGSNLGLVTGARIRIGGSYYNAASFAPLAGGTQIDATFTPSASGWPIGSYDFVTDQSGCVSSAIVNGFAVTCLTGTTFSGVAPAVGTNLQHTVQLTISGDNVNKLQTVQLFQPDPSHNNPGGDPTMYTVMPVANRTLNGTIVDASQANQITVAFDLSNAALGAYDLIGTRPDTCGNPANKVGAFTVNLPDSSMQLPVQVLKNANFDTVPSTGWTFGAENLIQGPFTCLGGDDYHSFCPVSKPYLAGKVVNGVDNVTETMEQAIGLPSGAGDYDMVLAFQVDIESPMFKAAVSSLKATIVADEGLPTENSNSVTILSNNTVWPYPTCQCYLHANLGFKGTATTSLKVKFQLTLFGNGGNPWGGVVLDDLVLYSAAGACVKPVADADGDGDIDQEDFAILQGCLTGPIAPVGGLQGACRCLDYDQTGASDGLIKAEDVAAFENCATGPDVLFAEHPNPNCWQQP